MEYIYWKTRNTEDKRCYCVTQEVRNKKEQHSEPTETRMKEITKITAQMKRESKNSG